MAKSYFRQIPNFEYVSRDNETNYISDYAAVKNLFKRGRIREDIFQDLIFFEKYSIIGDERPDNVAFKFYNDENLDWIILLSNNIQNIQTEWPLPQRIFDKTLLEKYGSYDKLYNDTHHFITKEIRNSLGSLVLKGNIEQPNSSGSFDILDKSIIKSVISLSNIGENKKTFITTTTPLSNLSVGSEIIIEGISNNEYNNKFKVNELVVPIGTKPTYVDLLPLNTISKIGDIYVTTIPDNQLWIFTGTDWINLGPAYYQGNNIISSFAIITKDNQFDESILEGAVDNTNITCDQNSVSCDLDVESFMARVTSIELGNSPLLNRISSSNSLRFYDPGLEKEVEIPKTDYLIPVTNYEYEREIENKKRTIYILKPRYLNIILNDMQELMEYKKGGTQYISPTLKRADNIRLFG